MIDPDIMLWKLKADAEKARTDKAEAYGLEMEQRERDLEARAETAENERDVLAYKLEQSQQVHGMLTRRAEAAEKREAALRESIEKILNGEIPLSISIKAHFLAALEAKP